MTSNKLISEAQKLSPAPWWKYGLVWMVIAGPLVVVVAAVFTAVLAFNSNDVIVSDNDPKTAALANYRSMVPAQTASYHAATPDAGLIAARERAAHSAGASVSTPSNSVAREPIQ